MKPLSSREVIARLRKDGWVAKSAEGSHHQFVHSTKPGKVTVPHPKRELSPGVLKSIEKQSGVSMR
ncbi:MAG TPA: addiction module toxin, HicA family [Alphaproteobacteria bacterium]|nr:addiction module toxin, HicA family [Alphaproteobacteria bacterium]